MHYAIPFPPGGESDIAARFQQIKFKQKFRQELIVETKVGAGGALAWAQLNNMAGDGCAMIDGGFEPIDVTLDLTPAFLAQRKKNYEGIARKMGLMK